MVQVNPYKSGSSAYCVTYLASSSYDGPKSLTSTRIMTSPGVYILPISQNLIRGKKTQQRKKQGQKFRLSGTVKRGEKREKIVKMEKRGGKY